MKVRAMQIPRISTTEVRVNENAGGQESNAGTRIGSPVSATDADNDDASLRYAIDPASDLFGIGESDGQITLSVATNFNYEKGEKEYTLTVQVKDPDGGSSNRRGEGNDSGHKRGSRIWKR